jgi:tetratricopeptide (TPR) repeat protein
MIILSIILFILGLAIFYWPNKVINFINWLEKVLLNKKKLLLQNKKIGLFFILVSIILIFTNIRILTKKNVMYKAYTNFYSHNFATTEKVCQEILNQQPNNIDAWILLGKTYFVTGRFLLSKSVFTKIKNMSYIREKDKKEIEKYLLLIDKKLEIQK